MSIYNIIESKMQDVLKDLPFNKPLRFPPFPPSATALMLISAHKYIKKSFLYICDSVLTLHRTYKDACTFAGTENDSILLLPPSSALLGNVRSNDITTEIERIKTLQTLRNTPHKTRIIITCIQSIMQKVPSPADWDDRTILLKLNSEFPFSSMDEMLSNAGYHFQKEVEFPGNAALRGGILDIWPPSERTPYRIEFDGNMVSSIRII